MMAMIADENGLFRVEAHWGGTVRTNHLLGRGGLFLFGGGRLEIELERVGDDLVVCLRDEATPFDPTTVPPPDLTLPLAKRPIGGLGIHLVRRTMDKIIHQVTASGGNELTLVKRDACKKQVNPKSG